MLKRTVEVEEMCLRGAQSSFFSANGLNEIDLNLLVKLVDDVLPSDNSCTH